MFIFGNQLYNIEMKKSPQHWRLLGYKSANCFEVRTLYIYYYFSFKKEKCHKMTEYYFDVIQP